MRIVADLFPEEMPRVRFDDHGETGALVQLSDENLVELAFEDHRHLRRWAAALVDAVDRRYGTPPPPPKRADDPEPEWFGAAALSFGRGD